MYFESFSELVAMGGHGVYVWSAYGVTVAMLGYMMLSPLVKKNAIISEIRASELIDKNRTKDGA